jgi:uncharacterized membrane protein YfcA
MAGGFIDSVGGGGWGPVTTSTLMAANRMSPNQVIGTVSAAEFIVALGSSAGFLMALGSQSIAWGAMVALLLGGLVAAPIAAWAVSRLDHRVLGGLVGGMILFYNAERVLSLVGLDGAAVLIARLAIVASTLFIVAVVLRSRQAGRAVSASEPVTDATPAA